MNGADELLMLRMVLLAIIFGFILLVAIILRGSVRAPGRTSQRAEDAMLMVREPGDTRLSRGDSFPLAGTMTIGRDVSCSIALADSSVSTRHAVISFTAAGWRVADSGSTNGTLVDGRAVPPRGILLRDGQSLAVGSVEFEFRPGGLS
jgi:pSer/pThr/pTyr-binding forkhead associated (FHA) protein